jgi:iron(III) transport system ATP-binding protein
MTEVVVQDLTISYGPVQAVRDVSFTARSGEFVTLLGPSGCGKTTTLRAVAGLERPAAGRIAIGPRDVFNAASGVNLPPEQRGLAMVFQSYAIWPHMTVFENVAFGLRAQGVAGAALNTAVHRGLELVGLDALHDRMATRLSGGQQQRVALARAIAAQSGVILLDEPLSNLDAQLRLSMRTEIKALQRRLGVTALYVTHDQEEALVLSDRIVVMRDGLVEQSGLPSDIHDRPRSRFVAEFVGVRNIFPYAQVAHLQLAAGDPGDGCLCFRPMAVRLSAHPVSGHHTAVVTSATYLGDLIQYELRTGDLTICARGLPRGDIPEGATVWWSVPPESCFFVTA